MTRRGKKLAVAIAIFAGCFGLWSFADKDFKLSKSIDIFLNLFKELNYSYVDEVDPEKLIESGIEGMLKTLDPYTTFIPESEMDDFKFQTTGQYGGIGALIRRIEDYIIIAEPYENMPAAKAGLKAGDKLLSIDGKTLKNKGTSDVSDLLKGTPGTKVKIEYLQPGSDKKLEVSITREKITIPNVPYYGIVKDSIGYIKLTNFTYEAGEEVKKALIDLKKQNAKSIVLDLRGNPGGLLMEAVKVTNNFVPQNKLVVFTKGKTKDNYKSYTTSSEPVDTIIPLVVLISRGSASASEIVAGAIQDLDRGVIIGQRSFGKGLVQQTRPLSYNTQLKVTTAKYYIPSGRCIQALDYAHRNEDGSVGYIPDSLIKEYKTAGGRIVRDGGGIQPDIKIKIEKLSDISFNLYAKNYIFDFSTQFAQSKNSIPKPGEFVINDSIYEEFRKFLDTKDFDYKTRTEESFSTLIEQAKKERYFDNAEQEFAQLKLKLSHDKAKDLETYRDEISEMLTDEIVSRYYYQKGKVIASFRYDKELHKAFEVLNKKVNYTNILQGKKTDEPVDEELSLSDELNNEQEN